MSLSSISEYALIGKLFQKKTIDPKQEISKPTFFQRVTRAIAGKSTIDDDLLDQIEEILIASDVGAKTAIKLVELLERKVAKEKYFKTTEVFNFLKQEAVQILEKSNDLSAYPLNTFVPKKKPYVILVVGVNGVGKTTSIGKLANQFRKREQRVLIGACDTFRYAAQEQLNVWVDRSGSDVVGFKENQKDPSAVAYQTLEKARKEDYDVVILDTAGRLHTKKNLMIELGKIERVLKKVIPEAPHEVLLVLDATTGQNTKLQMREFQQVVNVSGLIITKLDGTSKGGTVINLCDEFKKPIRFIGLGESIEQIEVFEPKKFIKYLFREN